MTFIPSVSIVMTTYNGSKFLLQQLESILKQTHPADECIICDDVSTDNTPELVRQFIAQNHLNNRWKFFENQRNKGCTENFLYALSLATQDVVFLADQDDIWHPQKIEKMLALFSNAVTKAVYCLENTIDENNQQINNIISKHNKIKTNTRLHEISLAEKLRYARSPGHLLALRKQLIPEIIAFAHAYQQPHDLPIGTIAAIYKKYYVLNEELGGYRVHSHNVSHPVATPWDAIKDFGRQITSRQLKYRELWGIKHTYWNKLTPLEQKQLDKAIVLSKQAIVGLKTGHVNKLIPVLFTLNPMLNRMLTLRNILSLIRKRLLC